MKRRSNAVHFLKLFSSYTLVAATAAAMCAGFGAPSLAAPTPTPPPTAGPVKPSANAKVCRLMPVADVEHALGVRLAKMVGADHEAVSTCSARFGTDTIVKVQHAKPGTEGLAPDVQTWLKVPREMNAGHNDIPIAEYGNVGCYGQHVKAKKNWIAVCANPHGYITLAVTRPTSMVPLDTVRKLLAAAQAKI